MRSPATFRREMWKLAAAPNQSRSRDSSATKTVASDRRDRVFLKLPLPFPHCLYINLILHLAAAYYWPLTRHYV